MLVFYLCIARMADAAASFGARLKWNKFSPAYRQRLAEGGVALDSFLRRGGSKLDNLEKAHPQVVDDVLESFVREMHGLRRSSSLRIAKHGVLFMQCLRPRLKRNLNATWNAIQSWEEQKPSGFRPPMPLALLAALVCKASLMATASDGRMQELWYRLSALLTVGFYGLLRPVNCSSCSAAT